VKAWAIMDDGDVMEMYLTRAEAEQAIRDDALPDEWRTVEDFELPDQKYFELLAEQASLKDWEL
jgi:hypothetical protein